MMPAIHIPPSAKEVAKETTVEMRKAFHSFYSQVSCTDLSAIQTPDCAPLKECNANNMEGAVTLDWRADPFVSMSDLTLVVYDGSGGIPYHVHTLLLVYGGRKSGFIAEQIKNQQNRTRSSSSNSKKNAYNMHRQNSSTSNGSNNKDAEFKVDIYVPPLAARHMPTFLDYLYGSSLNLTTGTAPSLRYLSNRFDCRDLHKEVTSRFIPQDLELSTAPQYCTMADELKDFELRDKSIRIIAERFEKINVNLLKWMHPRMMRSILQCDRLECGSESLSEKVAQYLRLRDEKSKANNVEEGVNSNSASAKEENEQIAPLNDEDFYWMTHCQHMPKISPQEALFYFSYGTRFPQVWNEIGSGSLKSRCLAACSYSTAMDELTSHLEYSDRNPLELYEKLDLKMKVQLLESSLVGARRLMVEKEKQFRHRDQSDRDVQLSDDIMYENNNESLASTQGNTVKVVVLGSGISPANGVYLSKVNDHASSAFANGAPSSQNRATHIIAYEKEAVWNQQRVTFVLYPVTCGQYYSQYKLGVREHNDSQTKVLYNSPTVVGASSNCIIPEQAWEVEDGSVEGLHPPPQFVGRMEQPIGSTTWNKNLKHSLP
mmetsp:Transcript_31508/g.76189  ORF Transcript_31508/g.76189 Transcript_31508/m.76189 type:complete len:600 (+) Transcript_31508:69-1868(+)